MIAEYEKHASSQRWTPWRSQCPISQNTHERTSNGTLQTFKKKTDLDACDPSQKHRAISRIVRVVKFHTKNSETEILFDTRPPQVTEVTRTYSSIGKQDPMQLHMESAREHPARPHMETAWKNRERENKDQAQGSSIDLRV